MTATDLFLRSRPKLQVTDLWLHGAGAAGSAPPPILASGTVSATAVLTGEDALAEGGAMYSVAQIVAVEALAAAGTVSATAVLTGEDALAEGGAMYSVAQIVAVEALAAAGTICTVAVLDGEMRLVARPSLPPFAVRLETLDGEAHPTTTSADPGRLETVAGEIRTEPLKLGRYTL